jgi:hypothetical protein
MEEVYYENNVRSIKELLQIMLDNKDLFKIGLCSWCRNLSVFEIINHSEKIILLKYIANNRPSKYSTLKAYRNRFSAYYWKEKDIKSRIEWIKKHIKKLK